MEDDLVVSVHVVSGELIRNHLIQQLHVWVAKEEGSELRSTTGKLINHFLICLHIFGDFFKFSKDLLLKFTWGRCHIGNEVFHDSCYLGEFLNTFLCVLT
jgi:hypothetical protein